MYTDRMPEVMIMDLLSSRLKNWLREKNIIEKNTSLYKKEVVS